MSWRAPANATTDPANSPAAAAAEQPVADLFSEHVQGMRRHAAAGRGRKHDQQDRNADPIVEPALDVERLPHPLRQSRVRDDRGAEPGVCRRQDHGQDECLA